jgi:hypothetical protein
MRLPKGIGVTGLTSSAPSDTSRIPGSIDNSAPKRKRPHSIKEEG